MIIFDLDGTLVEDNNDPVLREVLNFALRKSLNNERMLKEVKIKLSKWTDKDTPSDKEKTKIIIETVYEDNTSLDPVILDYYDKILTKKVKI